MVILHGSDSSRPSVSFRVMVVACGMPLSRIDLAHRGPAKGVESNSQVTKRSALPVSRGALRQHHPHSRLIKCTALRRARYAGEPLGCSTHLVI